MKALISHFLESYNISLLNLEKFLLLLVFGYGTLKIFKFLLGFYKTFLRPRKNFISRYGKESWAVITGASDGVGKAFSEKFAKLGFNIILVARNEEKLKDFSQHLEKTYNIQTKYTSFDYSKNSTSVEYEKAFGGFTNEDVSILVNNVGGMLPTQFDTEDIRKQDELLNLNIKSQVLMTRLFINKLLNRPNRSAIISLSSAAIYAPPQKTFYQYSASKLYNNYFSRGLSDEFKHKIDVLSVQPLFMTTPMNHQLKKSLFVIDPSECVEGVLNDLGYEEETVGNWKHKLLRCIYSCIPDFVIKKLRKRPKEKTH